MDKTVAPIVEDMVEHAYKTEPIDVLGFMIEHLQDVRRLSPTRDGLVQRSAKGVTTFAGMSQRLLVLEGELERCLRASLHAASTEVSPLQPLCSCVVGTGFGRAHGPPVVSCG